MRLAWFIVAALPLAVAGCGWAPLYADHQTGPADAALRQIRVAPIPDRIGQRLEFALRDSINPAGENVPQKYILRTGLVLSQQSLGIQSQGLGTEGKIDVSATYSLADITTGAVLFTNSSHVNEFFDIAPNGYATVVAQDDSRSRAVEELRQEIVTRLTAFMQRRAAEAAARP